MADTQIISSRNNKLIVDCSKLKNKKYRDSAGLFFFEGKKLLKEAIKCGVRIKYIFFTDESLSINLPPYTEAIRVTSSVYEKISEEKSPEGLFCVAEHIDKLHKCDKIEDDKSLGNLSKHKSYFIAESVRDPGNLGTIMRTASAMGIDMLILSDDCADIYNSKTVRAGMGAVFRQATYRVSDLPGIIGDLRAKGISVYAAALDKSSVSLSDIVPNGNKVCFAVGNEGHGLSDEVISACGKSVIIPMNGETESLNVSAATAILMWQERILNN